METKESTMQNGDESTYPDLHNSSRMPSTTSFNTTPPALYIEELSENDGTTAIEITPGEDVEEIVGFSIGQEQLRMKSPQTPAFEKAKVLDQSKDYLDVAPDDVEFSEYDAGLEKFPEPEEESVPHKALDNEESERPNGKSSPAAMPTPDASRSNASKSILKGAFVPRTRRASSGSINMVNTLKKLLPDLPSISLPKAPVLPTLGFGSKSKGETDVNRAKRSSTLFSRGSLPWISFTQSTHPETTAGNKEQSLAKENNSQREISLPGNNDANIRSAPGDSGGNVHQSNMPSRTALNPHLLKRYTSENSLFMRHDLERTSTQDDADKWGHVSEQINSRFKAITDSFQDSAMTRLPKMPSVNLASFKPGPLRSNSDNTRLNTHRNMAMAHADTPTHDRIQNTPSPQTDDQTKHAHPILNKAISDLTGDVVVLGGYRGSILRSAKPPHKQLWVPVKVRYYITCQIFTHTAFYSSQFVGWHKPPSRGSGSWP